jgi:hypothetical protein
MDFLNNLKGRMNEYSKNQSQAHNKDYFKDNFNMR